MKFLKYAMISLVLAVVTDAALASAATYPTPSATITGLVELPSNGNNVYTRWLTKNVDGTQTYYNSHTSTWLNNPCENCIVGTKPENEAGVIWDGFLTKMGITKAFTQNIAYVIDPSFGGDGYNNYRLAMYRSDGTLLTTNHSGTWTINPL